MGADRQPCLGLAEVSKPWNRGGGGGRKSMGNELVKKGWNTVLVHASLPEHMYITIDGNGK